MWSGTHNLKRTDASKPNQISNEYHNHSNREGRTNPSKSWTQDLTICPQSSQGGRWVKELQTTVKFSDLAKAILKLFKMYFRIEQKSKCVTVVGSQVCQGHTNMKWGKGRKNPEGMDRNWRYRMNSWFLKNMYKYVYKHVKCTHMFVCMCIYACIYSLALSTEKVKRQSHPSSNDHT